MSNQQPVNANSAPWAHTAQGHGTPAGHHRLHDVIQHPNLAHVAREAASPFVESVYGGLGWQGRARHDPDFSAPGGIDGGVRK